MTKSILVPLDGSETAERALLPARWLAHGLDAEVHVVMTTFDADVSALEAYLDKQASSIDAQWLLIPHAFATRGVADLLADLPDAALCMTTHGRGALSELILGSVSEELLRLVHVPTVLVGSQVEPLPEPAPNTIVVSVDGSAGSFAILPVVRSWSRQLGLDIHVVTVETEQKGAISGDIVLEEALAIFDRLGAAAQTHLLSGSPVAAIIDFAADVRPGLLAIGTHDHPGLLSTALGTVARHVVQQAPCPVLVHPNTLSAAR